ncbi:MAG: hypothetical protein R3B13_35970 [Polyangiaceae bacterium]
MMQREGAVRLSKELVSRGWYQSGERLVAPNGTLWLPVRDLCWLSLDGLTHEATQRLRRRKRGRKSYENLYDAFCAVDDAESLLDALRPTVEQTWQPLANAS